MLILSDKYTTPTTPESELQVYAKWWTQNSFPTSLEEADISDLFAVENREDRGSYYYRPHDATGIIVVSHKKLAAMAAWRNKEHKGPWQIYGEQEAQTVAFHYVGDSEVVFVGWV